MKRFLTIAAIVAASLTTTAHATDVGVSVSIGQPGFYGQIDIGGYPRPPVIYGQPILVERVPVHRPPIYLRVPPGHAKHWRHHCHEYRACGERVYFVQDRWYEREYVPRYQQRGRGDRDRWDDGRRDGYRDNNYRDERNDRRGDGRRGDDNDRGRGHGHGHGHDR